MSNEKKILYILFIVLFLSSFGMTWYQISVNSSKFMEIKADIKNFQTRDVNFSTLPPINVTMFSESSNTSNHIAFAGNATDPSTNGKIALKLPSPPQNDQWISQNASIRIYNLIDNKTYGLGNYDFSSGTDTGTPSINQGDSNSYFRNDTISNWEVVHDEHISPYVDYNDMTVEYNEASDYVELTYYGYSAGSNYNYDPYEYVAIRQTNFNIARGEIKHAWIKVIYNPVHWLQISQDKFAFSVEVNDKTVYEKRNHELGAGLVDTGWIETSSWINTSNVFSSPTKNGYTNCNFTLKLRFVPTTQLATNFPNADYQRVLIYGFYLAVEAQAPPNATDLQLKVNDHPIYGNFGNGYIQLLHTPSNFTMTDPYNLVFTSGTQEIIDVNFDVDVSFHIFKYKYTTETPTSTDTGVAFTVDTTNNKVNYRFYLYCYWDLLNFFNFYYNFSIPDDWNITLIKNPALQIIFNKSANFNLGVILEQGRVSVPAHNGTGDLVAGTPGWWYFEAEGPNYISNIDVLKKVGSNWQPASDFNSNGYSSGDQLKVKASIANATGVPPGVGVSSATLQITFPNGSLWVTQVNNSIDASTGEVTFGPFIMAGQNTTVGQFKVRVYWNYSYDYLSGYEKVTTPGSYYYGVGYAQSNFTVTHDSEIKLINPVDAQTDLVADLYYFDVFALKVQLNDTDSNTVISGASVEINWTSTIYLTEEAQGLYSTTLDTAELGGPGIYYLKIQASKVGITNSSLLLMLNIQGRSSLETLTAPPPGEFGTNFTVRSFYHLPGNPHYNYTNAQINVSTAPTSGYLSPSVDFVFSDLNDGSYEIIIFTGESVTLNQAEETAIYIHASKEFIENATKKETLYINPVPTNLVTNQSIYDAGFFQNVTFQVAYSIAADATPILGATISVSGHGTLPYSINELGNGIYTIEFNSSSTVNTYNILITANKTNYLQKSVSFLLQVHAADSILEEVGGVTPKTLSENVTLLMFYYKPNVPSQNYTSASISLSMHLSSNYLQENVDFLYTNNLNGTYSVIIFTGEGTSFSTVGQYSIYVHASQLYVNNATRKVDLFLEAYETVLTSNKTIFMSGMFVNISLYVNYTLALDGTPVTGASLSLSGMGSLPYTIKEVGSGIYRIEINTTGTIATYDIVVTASKTNYDQKSVSFLLTVDAADSTLETLSTPTPQTLGQNITLTIFYHEPGNPLTNYTNALIQLSLNVTSNYLTESVDFIYTNNLDGTYTAIVFTGPGTSFDTVGQHALYVHAGQAYIKNASLKVDLFLDPYSTTLATPQTFFSSGIYENVTITVKYTRQADGSPIIGATVTISGQGSLAYTVRDLGMGQYAVEFNASDTVTSYNILLTLQKPNYEQKSQSFVLVVDRAESTLENLLAITPQTLGENITAQLFYYEPGNSLQNYTTATITVSLNLTANYLIEFVDFLYINNFDGTYTLTLFTGPGTAFSQTGQYAVYVHANQLYVKNASRKLDIFLNAYPTSLTTNQSLFSAGLYQNITFYLNYSVLSDATPITGATFNISGQGALPYSFQDLGTGLYILELNSSGVGATYDIVVTASKSNYEQKSLSLILIVGEHNSILETVNAPAPVTLSENVTMILLYYAPGNPAQNYTSALMEVSRTLTSDYLTVNTDYIYTLNPNGTYTLTIFTGAGTVFNTTGQYSVYIHASQIHVKNASRKIDLFLNAYQTVLTTNQSIFIKGMYENVTLFLNYTLLLDGSPIIGANMSISGIGGLDYTPMELGNGIYTIELNTSSVKKSYDILVVFSKINFEQKSQSFILSVSDYDTLLTTNKTIFQAQSNQNVTIYVNYTKEDGTPIENANLYVLGISLDYTKRELGDGLYSIEINASDIFANYDIIVILNKTNYKQKSLTFVLSVNVLDSILEVIQGQSLINFRENLTLMVRYSLPSDPNTNYTEATIKISSEVDADYWIENIHYNVVNNLDGTYNLTIFTGETMKINTTEQNIIHIHAIQPNIRNATRSYSFFINPIQTELIINQTVFEIPKYESVNFTIQYRTIVGGQPLTNASVTLFGISNYSVQSISPGLYRVILRGGNETKSYSITLIADKQNYAIATTDIVLLVRGLEDFITINASQIADIVTMGETTEFVFSFYYEYSGEYLTESNITVSYSWIYGSGTLIIRNETLFVLPIDTSNIPPGEYHITISVYDRDNNLFAQQQLTLTVNAVPTPPWLYAIIGAAIIGIIVVVTMGYYYKVHKPRAIFKNKALMEKYYKYLDAKNLQYLLIIDKNSGITIGSIKYQAETEVDADLISGFLQAIGSFGTELTGVETAMKNITYKGSKIVMEQGQYINACALLKEEETPSFKAKLKAATTGFEQRYASELQQFAGNVGLFEGGFTIFDENFEIYLNGMFKLNYDRLAKHSKTLNKNQKEILRVILKHEGKSFTLEKLFTLLKSAKIKLAELQIFSELYDLITNGFLISATPAA